MGTNELKMTVKINRLLLATDNPRHEEVDSQEEAILKLCNGENIAEIARDIARHGLDPSARLIVYPAQEDLSADKIGKGTTFLTAEGNRRLCALKLLHDPKLAPAQIFPAIERSSNQWASPIDEVDVVVILDNDRRKHWLNRIHNGAQGGVGRKQWSSEQKTRFNGSKRNIIAQSLFDFAQAKNLISESDRKGSFSHMARLVGNVLVAETMGIDASNGPENLRRTRPYDVFEFVLKRILQEAIDKKLGSQASKKDIDDFARTIQSSKEFSNKRVEPEALPRMEDKDIDFTPSDNAEEKDASRGDSDTRSDQAVTLTSGDSSHKPQTPHMPECIAANRNIEAGLEDIGRYKLRSLYASICQVNAKKHTPLVTVGVWSFIESLTAAMGRKDSIAFNDYFSANKLQELGIEKGASTKACTEVIKRIATNGNLTKHHEKAGQFNYPQLINDLSVLDDLIIKCIAEIKNNG